MPAEAAFRVLLASRSPRRSDLLAAAGLAFDVAVAAVDERPRAGEDPRAYVIRLAGEKADDVACRNFGRVVLGADTGVVVDGQILGKPEDDGDAVRMLRTLSGRTHEVLTGVVLRQGDRRIADASLTRVRFLPLEDREIAWYVATGEPRDKAGAYAIQGRASRFIDWIEGSYSNVIGLPIALVYRLLREFGLPE